MSYRDRKHDHALDFHEKETIKLFLRDNISSRELGKFLNCSHQNAINVSLNFVKREIENGGIIIKIGKPNAETD